MWPISGKKQGTQIIDIHYAFLSPHHPLPQHCIYYDFPEPELSSPCQLSVNVISNLKPFQTTETRLGNHPLCIQGARDPEWHLELDPVSPLPAYILSAPKDSPIPKGWNYDYSYIPHHL